MSMILFVRAVHDLLRTHSGTPILEHFYVPPVGAALDIPKSLIIICVIWDYSILVVLDLTHSGTIVLQKVPKVPL